MHSKASPHKKVEHNWTVEGYWATLSYEAGKLLVESLAAGQWTCLAALVALVNNVGGKRVAPYQLFAMRHLLTTMAQPTTTQLPYNEGDIPLAISSTDATQIPSVQRAAAMFNVPEATLRDRRARKPT